MAFRHSSTPLPGCSRSFSVGLAPIQLEGVVCIIRVVWICFPHFSLSFADLPFRLDSLSPLVFQSSSCKYSDIPLISIVYNANNVVIEGILYLVFGFPSFWLCIIDLFSRYCCCFDILMALVLYFVDSLVIRIDSILCLRILFSDFLQYILF